MEALKVSLQRHFLLFQAISSLHILVSLPQPLKALPRAALQQQPWDQQLWLEILAHSYQVRSSQKSFMRAQQPGRNSETLKTSCFRKAQEGKGSMTAHHHGEPLLCLENRPIRAARTAVINKAQQLLCSVVFSLRWMLPWDTFKCLKYLTVKKDPFSSQKSSGWTHSQMSVCSSSEISFAWGNIAVKNASDACKLRHFLSLPNNPKFFKAKNRRWGWGED